MWVSAAGRASSGGKPEAGLKTAGTGKPTAQTEFTQAEWNTEQHVQWVWTAQWVQGQVGNASNRTDYGCVWRLFPIVELINSLGAVFFQSCA